MKVSTEKCRNGRRMLLFDILHMPNASFNPKLLEDNWHINSLSLQAHCLWVKWLDFYDSQLLAWSACVPNLWAWRDLPVILFKRNTSLKVSGQKGCIVKLVLTMAWDIILLLHMIISNDHLEQDFSVNQIEIDDCYPRM